MDELVEIVNGDKPGDSLELTILRDGSTKTVTVTLGDRPDSVERGHRRARRISGRSLP